MEVFVEIHKIVRAFINQVINLTIDSGISHSYRVSDIDQLNIYIPSKETGISLVFFKNENKLSGEVDVYINNTKYFKVNFSDEESTALELFNFLSYIIKNNLKTLGC